MTSSFSCQRRVVPCFPAALAGVVGFALLAPATLLLAVFVCKVLKEVQPLLLHGVVPPSSLLWYARPLGSSCGQGVGFSTTTSSQVLQRLLLFVALRSRIIALVSLMAGSRGPLRCCCLRLVSGVGVLYFLPLVALWNTKRATIAYIGFFTDG